MGNIIKVSNIPENDRVYLKKDFLGYRIIHPIKNEDGSWNWLNLLVGGESNLVFLILLVLVGVTIYFGINEIISQYKLIADNPCDFCYDCANNLRPYVTSITKFNLTG